MPATLLCNNFAINQIPKSSVFFVHPIEVNMKPQRDYSWWSDWHTPTTNQTYLAYHVTFLIASDKPEKPVYDGDDDHH